MVPGNSRRQKKALRQKWEVNWAGLWWFSVICIFFPIVALVRRKVHTLWNTLRGLSLFTLPFSQHTSPFILNVCSADRGLLSSSPNLPNVMLLSVTGFPWAVRLFPSFSNLINGVSYYEKLACGWRFDTWSPNPAECRQKSLWGIQENTEAK